VYEADAVAETARATVSGLAARAFRVASFGGAGVHSGRGSWAGAGAAGTGAGEAATGAGAGATGAGAAITTGAGGG